MAIFSSFLLGSVKKSVANLTMYITNGVNIVRSKPLSVRNPRTDKQMVQRAKIKFLSELSADFGAALSLGFPQVRGLNRAANVFVKENMEWVTVDESFNPSIDFSMLVCSKGRLKQPIVSAEWNEENGELVFTQTVQGRTVKSNPTDEVIAVVYEQNQKEAEVFVLKSRSEGGTTNVVVPNDWNSTMCHIYVFALTADGTMASKTCYLS